jgi:RNA-directed DNA polymerase
MKRIGNLYEKFYSKENLILADQKARKGKRNQKGVKIFDQDKDAYLDKLHLMLKNKEYKTSAYTTFKIREPKERIIFRLPYFPDRIVHHAAMNQLEDMFVSTFTADTYSCIKGKGIKAASDALDKALVDVEGTQYCLKIDIKKFYPNINHDILKKLSRKKIKDKEFLELLDGTIDSAGGLPIGNFLSQFFANFYLTYFDH